MKTFQEFMSLCEGRDESSLAGRLGWGGGASITRQGGDGRVGRERKKSAPERRRVKAVGGGKTEPAKEYKPRKDIGTQRQASTRVQQPTQERGSADVKAKAAEAAKEERKKAALARIAAKKGGGEAPAASKPKAKEASATASKLLSKKKEEKPVSPDYKPAKASGLSRQERLKVTRQGEAKLRDLVLQSTGKTSEKQLKHRYTSR